MRGRQRPRHRWVAPLGCRDARISRESGRVADEAESLATRLAAAAREAAGDPRPSLPTLDGRSAVLLDQYPLWHDAVELVLQRLEVAVVGRHAAPDDALATIEQNAPDVLITDLELAPGLDGAAFVRLLRNRYASLRVVVLTLADQPEHVNAALTADADAYDLKAAHPDDLATAVRQCFAHSLYLAAPQEGASKAAPLTTREVEILRLVAEGYSNRRLAELLAVSEPTVKFHLTNVYRKLGVANRTEASRWAQREGILGAAGQGGRR